MAAVGHSHPRTSVGKKTHEPLTDTAQQTKDQQDLQDDLIQHIESYHLKLEFPANVFSPSSPAAAGDASHSSADSSSYLKSTSVPRTSQDFVNFRLLDSGLQFSDDMDSKDETQTVADVSKALASFVSDMNKTGCYDMVQVILGRRKNDVVTSKQEQASSSPNVDLRQVDVILNEKRWYKLYIGGGIKPVSGISSFGTSPSDFMPKVQFETSGGLINLTGHCDMTLLSYSVDQTSLPTLTLSHSRPLYSLLNQNKFLQDLVLGNNQGSRLTATLRAEMDTIDYEHLRSSKDHHQLLGLRISNQPPQQQPLVDGVHKFIEWSLASRDIVPKRAMNWPYLCDSSPEIVASSGPTLKHSITFETRMNGTSLDNKFNPTEGIDAYAGAEVAGPPGDVGFIKLWGGGSLHFPFIDYYGLTFHLAFNTGILKPLRFGGSCSSGGITSVNDRFFIGGPNQLRGFIPGGIGPRSRNVSFTSVYFDFITRFMMTQRLTLKGGSMTPGGDALGGDVFYTATGAVSVPCPIAGARLFAFVNAGTLTGWYPSLNFSSFLKTTRISIGSGLSFGTPMGRVEATYSMPIRYGPMDARRSVQLGVGLNFS